MLPFAHRILKPIERFLRIEAASGVVLLLAATAALILANSRLAALYGGLWSAPITLGLGPFQWRESVRFWINDGLMTIFFLLMGLEIRSEIHDGALAEWRTASLPLIAAVTGVAAPALIYLAVNRLASNGDPTLRHGWAIPTATDIAFAVGVLTLLGKRIPAALRTLLLTLAIVDDIAAMMIIAVFYSSGIVASGLLIAGGAVVAVLGMQRIGIRNPLAYALPGAVVWLGMLRAGVHPALAGVVLGLLTPAGVASAEVVAPSHGGTTALARLEALLHPWVAFLIMPLFAFANAGVSLGGVDAQFTRTAALSGGVVLGLVLGKPIGILLGAAASVRLGLSALPAGIDWRHLLVLGCLGGIGFTMSIFIGALAFSTSTLLATAKFAVLSGSLIAAVLGLGLGLVMLRPHTP